MWVLNSMSFVLIKDTQRSNTKRRRSPYEDRGRGQNDVAMSQGTSGATRS